MSVWSRAPEGRPQREVGDGPVHVASRAIADRNESYLWKLRRHGRTRNVHCTVTALIDYAGGRMAELVLPAPAPHRPRSSLR
jgi:hypothetical protein